MVLELIKLLWHKKIFRVEINPFRLVFLQGMIFSIIFSYLSIDRYYRLMIHYDLAQVVQAIYNTAFRGLPLYQSSTINVALQADEFSYLGIHFSPILFLLVPFYRLLPRVEFLLVLKCFITGYSVLPAYLISRDYLGEKKSLVLATLYLLNPGLHSATLVNLQPAMFIPITFFSCLYFLRIRKKKFFYIFLFLTLITHEFMGILLAAFFLVDYFRSREMKNKAEIGWAAVSVTWTLFAFQIMNLIKPLELPINSEVFSINIVGALSYDFFGKVVLVLLILTPFCLIPTWSPYILSVLPFFIWCSFLNKSSLELFGWHYGYYYLPFLYLAFLDSVRDIQNRQIIVMCLLCLILTPLNPLTVGKLPGMAYVPQPFEGEHISAINKIIGLIPPGTTVVAHNPIYTILSGRNRVFLVIPISMEVDYVVADVKHWDIRTYSFDYLLEKILNEGEYTVMAQLDGVFLFKKGYKGPILFEPFLTRFSFSGTMGGVLFLGDGLSIYDPTSLSGAIAVGRGSTHPIDVFWYGPYKPFFPGKYNVTYRLKICGEFEGNSEIIILDIVSDKGKDKFAEFVIKTMDIPCSNEWFNITFSFSLSKYVRDMEFRGTYLRDVDLYLDYIEVKMIPSP